MYAVFSLCLENELFHWCSLERGGHGFKLGLLARTHELAALFSWAFIFLYYVVRKNLTTSSCLSLVAVKQ